MGKGLRRPLPDSSQTFCSDNDSISCVVTLREVCRLKEVKRAPCPQLSPDRPGLRKHSDRQGRRRTSSVCRSRQRCPGKSSQLLAPPPCPVSDTAFPSIVTVICSWLYNMSPACTVTSYAPSGQRFVEGARIQVNDVPLQGTAADPIDAPQPRRRSAASGHRGCVHRSNPTATSDPDGRKS